MVGFVIDGCGNEGDVLKLVGGIPKWVSPTIGGGGGGGGSQVLDRAVTPLVVANTIVETPVYSFSVPGGTLGTNKRLRLQSRMHVPSTFGDSLTLRLRFGSDVIVIAGPMFSGGSGYQPITGPEESIRLDAEITARGAANQQDVVALLLNGSSYVQGFVKRKTMSEDTSLAKLLSITAEWSGANPNNQFVRDTAILELL